MAKWDRLQIGARALFKGAALLGLAVLVHVLIFSTKRSGDKLLLDELRDVRAIAHSEADVLYFGDSTLTPDANSKLGTSELLQEQLPGHRVAKIAHAAYHMGVYEAFTRYALEQGYRPKAVVVPINLRSFSASWDRRPEYQFVEPSFLLTHSSLPTRALYGPLKIFKGLDLQPINQESYRDTPVLDGAQVVAKVREFEGPRFATYSEENLRDIVILHYMFELRAEHRKMQQMVSLASMLRASGIEAVFYITPVDHQACAEALGPRFEERLSSNVEVVKRALAEQQVTVLDLSRALDSTYFNWRVDKYPNEHMLEPGRRFVASAIARAIEGRGP